MKNQLPQLKQNGFVLKNLMFVFLFAFLIFARQGWGQISIASLPYNPAVTNFNSYNPNSAANFTATIPAGWTGSSAGTATYNGQGTGTSATGGYWAYGTAGEFSLGALRSGTPLNITYSVSFVNNSGTTITAITLAWDYEQWRYANTSGWDCSGTGALLGNATLNGKDFAGVAVGTSGTVSVTGVASFTLSGLSIANGATFGISWVTTDITGSDNGVAIDNFSLAALSTTPLSATQSQTNASCFGVCNGSATVTPSGGVTPYSYAWSPSGGSGPTASSLCAGNYTCTITDNGGGNVVKNFTITQPVAFTVGVSPGSGTITCTTPSILLTASPSALATYQWSTGATTSSITVSSGNTYTVTATNNSTACTATSSAVISQNTTPPSASVTPPSAVITCASPTVLLTASGGGTYLWSTGATTTSILVSSANTYTVTATGANGCTASATASVTATQNTASCGGGNVSCFGGNNGFASITPTSGTAPFTYLWSNGNTNSIIAGLTAGAYCATVTDAGGCTATCCYTVTQPAVLTATATSTNASCPLCGDGTVSISSNTGGTPPYSYTPSNPRTGLLPGNYCITVTDQNGCTTSACATVGAAGCTMGVNMTLNSNVTCAGVNSGSATASPTGFVIGPLSYQWDNGNTNAIANNLNAGNHYAVITDNGTGCVAQGNITIGTNTTPPSTAVTPPSASITCGSPTVLLTASGGGTYLWSTGATTTSITVSSANTYSVTATAANGCTASASSTVTGNTTPPSAAVTSPSGTITCTSPTVLLTASGGGTYLWSTGATTTSITVSSANTYSVTVTGANGCTASASSTVTGNTTPPSAAVTPLSGTITCASPTVLLTASGGGTYLWSTGATTTSISVSSANTYTVTATGANGCTASASSTVTGSTTPPSPAVTPPSATITCASPSALLTASGGGTYLWSTGATTTSITVSSASTYTVTATGANGCTASASSSVTVNTTPPALSATSTPSTCNTSVPGTIDLTPTGGTPCSNANAKGLIISKISANPTGSDSPFEFVELVATKNIDFSVTPYTVIFNNNGTATASGWVAGSALTYAFQINSGTAVAGGIYYVGGDQMPATGNRLRAINTGTTAGDGGIGSANSGGILGNGGANADGVAVFNLPVPSVTSSSVPIDAVFFGSGIGAAVVSGGAQGYQLPVNELYSGGKLQSGSFFVGDYFVASDRIMTATGTYDVQSNSFTTPRTFANNSLLSFTQGSSSIALTNSQPYSYNWSNGASTQDISGLTAGNYTVTVTDCNGCSASISQTVQNVAPLVAVITGNLSFCSGSSTTLDAGSGYSNYSWSTGATTQTINVNTATTVTVTVTDGNGCTGSDSKTTTVNASPSPTISGNLSFCSGGSTTLDAGAGYSLYNWSTGATTQTINVNTATTVTVTVTDGNGCSGSDNETTTIIAAPTAAISGNNNICLGQNASVQLSFTGTGPWSGTVSDGSNTVPFGPVGTTSTNVTVTPSSGGTHNYTVTALSDANCGSGNGSGTAVIKVSTAAPTNSTGQINTPATACANQVSEISVNVVGGQNIQYSWNTGSGSGTVLFSTSMSGPFSAPPFVTDANTVIVQFGTPGGSGYEICVQGFNGCGSTNNKCQFIRGKVGVPGTIVGSAVACPNDVKPYTAGASGGATNYSWTLAGSSTPITNGQGTTNVQVTFPPAFVSGQLCVTASLACGGSSTSLPRCMTITKNPAVPGAFTPGPSKVCPGASGVIFTVPNDPSVTNYSWTYPAGCTVNGAANTNSLSLNFPANYSGAPPVCVSALSPCGTSVARCKTVGSYIPGQPAAIQGPSTNICNSTAQFEVTTDPNATGGYLWTNPSGTTITSGQGSSTILLSVANNFTSGNLTVIAKTASCSPGNSPARTLLITGKPNTPATITSNPLSWCANATVNFSTNLVSPLPIYSWSTNKGVVTSGQGTSNVDITWTSGSGYVNVIASNTCGASGTKSQTFTSSCREENEFQVSGFGLQVYPNPAHDMLTVSIDVKESSALLLELTDITGRIVLSENETAPEGLNSYQLGLNHLSKGVYMLDVKSAGESRKTKVVVE